MFKEGWMSQLCQAGTTQHWLPPSHQGLCTVPLLLHISWMAWTPFPARSLCFLAWGSLCLSPHSVCCPLSPGLSLSKQRWALVCCWQELCLSHAPFMLWQKEIWRRFFPPANLRSLLLPSHCLHHICRQREHQQSTGHRSPTPEAPTTTGICCQPKF